MCKKHAKIPRTVRNVRLTLYVAGATILNEQVILTTVLSKGTDKRVANAGELRKLIELRTNSPLLCGKRMSYGGSA